MPELITTDLVEINLGLRILLGSSFYGDWQNAETFVKADPLGNPIDGLGEIEAETRRALELQAPTVVQRQSVKEPDEDPDYEDIGQAFPSWEQADREAVLQPPKPPIPPSERLAEREAEAGEREL